MGAITTQPPSIHGVAAADASADEKEKRPSTSNGEDTAISDNERLPPKGDSDTDGPAVRTDDDEDEDQTDNDVGHEATRVKSTASIAEAMPLWREVIFVATICLGQLYTRKSMLLPPYRPRRTSPG